MTPAGSARSIRISPGRARMPALAAALARRARRAIGQRQRSRPACLKASSLMTGKGWLTRFDEPIVLDDGTKLSTLRDAIHYLAKTVPRAERYHETVLTAADHLTRSAEQGYSLFF